MTSTKTTERAVALVDSTETDARRAFAAAEASLNASFPERAPLVRLLLAAFVAGEHLLMLGEPGVAKSALANAFCGMLRGAPFFAYLMTRFTEPGEVMGPLDVKLLADTGRMKALTAGRLSEARVGFLDEVFKSNSAALNALLTMVNERRFFDDGAWRKAPLDFLVAASNEVPEEGDHSVAAFYDRILVRYVVKALDDDAAWDAMIDDDLPAPAMGLLDDVAVDAARCAAAKLRRDPATKLAMRAIARELRSKGIVVSDRRWKQAKRLMAAAAWLDGASSVTHGYVALLEHVAWSQSKQIPEVEATVKKHAPQWDTEARAIRAVIDQHVAALAQVAGMPTAADRLEAIGGVIDSLDGTDGGSPGLRQDIDALEAKHKEAADACAQLRAACDDLEQRATAANIAARRAGRKL